jgi:hypothetical protein
MAKTSEKQNRSLDAIADGAAAVPATAVVWLPLTRVRWPKPYGPCNADALLLLEVLGHYVAHPALHVPVP